jgi:hypothetical protein
MGQFLQGHMVGRATGISAREHSQRCAVTQTAQYQVAQQAACANYLGALGTLLLRGSHCPKPTSLAGFLAYCPPVLQVKQCTEIATGLVCAVKIIGKHDKEFDEELLALEVELMLRLKGHANVVKIFAVYGDDEAVYIVMEHMCAHTVACE